MKNYLRKWLGINQDMANVAQDITQLLGIAKKNEANLFELFHALPFGAGILTMQAKDAARFTNVKAMEANALIPILTTIIMAARQGQSYLEVQGELSPFVRDHLEKRGFKVEDTTGTNDAKGLFILWT